MHDILYAVRPGDDNDELRYSLRSLANLPHRAVWIVGHKPKWVVNVIHIQTDQTDRPDLENVNNALLAAAGCAALSDDFVFMNDDFFIMEPIAEIPVLHQGDLLDRIEAYKKSSWLQAYSLMTTRRWLVKRGAFQSLSYELHVPMVFNKDNLLKMYAAASDLDLFMVRPRTLYGNLYNINGAQQSDVKNSQKTNQTFLSTDESSFNTSLTGEKIRTHFNTPSRYETADPKIMGLQNLQEQVADRHHRDTGSRL